MRADIRFDGPRDLAGFVRPAQAEGPDVLVRPGPCICAERDNGACPPG
ncbi:beta-galactosidase [Streptomyces sp. NPDC059402]